MQGCLIDTAARKPLFMRSNSASGRLPQKESCSAYRLEALPQQRGDGAPRSGKVDGEEHAERELEHVGRVRATSAVQNSDGNAAREQHAECCAAECNVENELFGVCVWI